MEGMVFFSWIMRWVSCHLFRLEAKVGLASIILRRWVELVPGVAPLVSVCSIVSYRAKSAIKVFEAPVSWSDRLGIENL